MFKVSHIIIFSFLLSYISCTSPSEKIYPARQDITLSVYASGKIKSKQQYVVQPIGNGYIQTIHVSEGQTVREGELLFTLSNEASRLNRDLARLSRSYAEQENNEARLKDLEEKIALARDKKRHDSVLWERQQNLFEKGIGSKLELEQKRLQQAQSQTEFNTLVLNRETLIKELEFNAKNALKNFEIASSMTEDLLIKSKIKGKVYALLREEGELVNQQSNLAVLGDGDEFLLELLVDEYDIAQIDIGQQIKVHLDSYRDQIYDAVVTKILPLMDEKTKSFVVEAEFTNAPPKLYPNLTLEANIILEVKENALIIPSAYLIGERYVIAEEGDTLEVKTGIKNYQDAEIIEGIDENTALLKP
ncbi:RND family efflux transporter, MFP subunit [Cyclobacterium lianum]|uniref:RND family efflux transporter, MFP subunit n=1 Tax=Cyclobacterium lianum TaxID=388280 RepID=A0A1M7Q8M2_9BACT|nr:efflux RND transporter periplasmic adaptor subunit [Cyclobacterium lianum]SHN26899.1 RND family efflux transporter, MFP subunit [Cyclobacterium lianum]